MGVKEQKRGGPKKDCLARNGAHACDRKKSEKALPKTPALGPSPEGDDVPRLPELPPLQDSGHIARGAVIAQYVRCGKPACRCASGSLHGPYWYRFFREEGRLFKQYIPGAEVEQVRAECKAYRQLQAHLLYKRRESQAKHRIIGDYLRAVRWALGNSARPGRHALAWEGDEA